jgi:hypothetical protein
MVKFGLCHVCTKYISAFPFVTRGREPFFLFLCILCGTNNC